MILGNSSSRSRRNVSGTAGRPARDPSPAPSRGSSVRPLPATHTPATPAFRHTSKYEANVSQISLCDLDDHGLTKLSRQAHLFLSLDEMLAIQKHYRSIGREPTDIELETLAQTWSEHCVHKTFKATVHYHPDSNDKSITGLGPDQIADRPGHTLNDDGSITIQPVSARRINNGD